jgi:adenosylcobyric acid synthase
MTKNLMVVGTGSHVGKSIIVTALCRIFSKKYSVAPFKAQNMSLNSWVTHDGGEIGIAQAIQAKAAGVEPTCDMNPVLLKPKGDHTSQVIILGKPVADKEAGDYYNSIDEVMSTVAGAYDRLSDLYELIIIEGAGGAAEINLYHRDIVNTGMARLVKPPMILVGDIERGGVFASIYGTIQLLPDDIRGLVRGLVINKFRGDMKLLEPGMKQLEEITGIPVIGVIPYTDLRIPSEDSVSIKDKTGNGNPIKIVVIRLPHISNFTDFEPLEHYADIEYVELNDTLPESDAIILPGTKNTMDDMKALLSSGIGGKIIAQAKRGTEGTLTIKGLELLDVSTHFATYEKKTRQVKKLVTGHGNILGVIKGQSVTGYEIHMGETQADVSAFGDDGSVSENGLVIGTYLHGLFENDNIRTSLLTYLYSQKGLLYQNRTINDGIEGLAEFIGSHLNMELINGMLEEP